jgi:hypothetical protein
MPFSFVYCFLPLLPIISLTCDTTLLSKGPKKKKEKSEKIPPFFHNSVSRIKLSKWYGWVWSANLQEPSHFLQQPRDHCCQYCSPTIRNVEELVSVERLIVEESDDEEDVSLVLVLNPGLKDPLLLFDISPPLFHNSRPLKV